MVDELEVDEAVELVLVEVGMLELDEVVLVVLEELVVVVVVVLVVLEVVEVVVVVVVVVVWSPHLLRMSWTCWLKDLPSTMLFLPVHMSQMEMPPNEGRLAILQMMCSSCLGVT